MLEQDSSSDPRNLKGRGHPSPPIKWPATIGERDEERMVKS